MTSRRSYLTERALADLDAAPPLPLTAEQRSRADATLREVLATDPHAVTDRNVRSPRRARHPSRWLLLAGAAALAAAAAVVVPGVTRPDTAYASWSPRPVTVSASEAKAAQQTCVHYLDNPANTEGEIARVTAMLRTSHLVVADRRGRWTYVVLATDTGFTADCFFGEAPLLARLFGDRYVPVVFGMGVGPVSAPATDGLVGLTFGGGGSDAGGYVSTTGLVGSDVARVMVTTPDGRRVQASVAGGRFVAWWPVPGNSYPPDDVLFTVTLKDGTVLPALSYSQITVPDHKTAG